MGFQFGVYPGTRWQELDPSLQIVGRSIDCAADVAGSADIWLVVDLHLFLFWLL